MFGGSFFALWATGRDADGSRSAMVEHAGSLKEPACSTMALRDPSASLPVAHSAKKLPPNMPAPARCECSLWLPAQSDSGCGHPAPTAGPLAHPTLWAL